MKEGFSTRKFKFICCEILYREACLAAALSPHKIDLEFVTKGLHDMKSGEMLSRMQSMVDASQGKGYDAILLGYALCNNGTAGLVARDVPLVVPRAHDCITIFLGSRAKYKEYFDANPGTYFLTSGWIERGGSVDDQSSQLSISRQSGMDKSYEELVAEYGEDNAKFLYETLCQPVRNYSKFCFIETGVEPDSRFEDYARSQAEVNSWAFEKLKGDMSLLKRLANGDWDSGDFATVKPGETLKASYGDDIFVCKKCV